MPPILQLNNSYAEVKLSGILLNVHFTKRFDLFQTFTGIIKTEKIGFPSTDL